MEKLFDVEYQVRNWAVRIEYVVNEGYGGITIYIRANLGKSLLFARTFEGSVSKDEAVAIAQRMLKELGEDFLDMTKKVISDMKSDLKYRREIIFGSEEEK